MNILLVEPDQLIANNISRLLTKHGHAVTWSPSAQAALHIADKQRPDVLILEPQLALHGGIEFMHEFRSYPEWERVPVILFSSLPATDESTWQRLGIDRFLYKSTDDLHQLVAALEQLPQAA